MEVREVRQKQRHSFRPEIVQPSYYIVGGANGLLSTNCCPIYTVKHCRDLIKLICGNSTRQFQLLKIYNRALIAFSEELTDICSQ